MTFQNSLRKKRKKMMKKCNVLSEKHDRLDRPMNSKEREGESVEERVRKGLAKIQTRVHFWSTENKISSISYALSVIDLQVFPLALVTHVRSISQRFFDSSRERDGATMLMTFQASAGHVSKSSLKNVRLFPFYSSNSFKLA